MRNAGTFRFFREEHIKKSAEIQGILKKGSMRSCRGMRLFWVKNDLGRPRMAIALKRGYGTAVERNRAKRLIRESFRLLKADIPGGADMVFLVFPAPDTFAMRNEQMTRLCREAGLLRRAQG
jgi:ribonuclease P protein component